MDTAYRNPEATCCTELYLRSSEPSEVSVAGVCVRNRNRTRFAGSVEKISLALRSIESRMSSGIARSMF